MNDVIMVVDDEPAVLGFIQELLMIKGYKAEGFANGMDALSAFKESPSDYGLVITDQTMPGLLGMELIEKLKTIHPVPAIICSGYSEHLDKETARALGADAFLSKPFEAKCLMDTIRNIIDRK